MKEFFIGLLVLLLFLLMSIIGFLLLPLLIVLGVLLQWFLSLVLILLGVWVVGKVTLVGIEHVRKDEWRLRWNFLK